MKNLYNYKFSIIFIIATLLEGCEMGQLEFSMNNDGENGYDKRLCTESEKNELLIEQKELELFIKFGISFNYANKCEKKQKYIPKLNINYLTADLQKKIFDSITQKRQSDELCKMLAVTKVICENYKDNCSHVGSEQFNRNIFSYLHSNNLCAYHAYKKLCENYATELQSDKINHLQLYKLLYERNIEWHDPALIFREIYSPGPSDTLLEINKLFFDFIVGYIINENDRDLEIKEDCRQDYIKAIQNIFEKNLPTCMVYNICSDFFKYLIDNDIKTISTEHIKNINELCQQSTDNFDRIFKNSLSRKYFTKLKAYSAEQKISKVTNRYKLGLYRFAIGLLKENTKQLRNQDLLNQVQKKLGNFWNLNCDLDINFCLEYLLNKNIKPDFDLTLDECYALFYLCIKHNMSDDIRVPSKLGNTSSVEKEREKKLEFKKKDITTKFIKYISAHEAKIVWLNQCRNFLMNARLGEDPVLINNMQKYLTEEKFSEFTIKNNDEKSKVLVELVIDNVLSKISIHELSDTCFIIDYLNYIEKSFFSNMELYSVYENNIEKFRQSTRRCQNSEPSCIPEDRKQLLKYLEAKLEIHEFLRKFRLKSTGKEYVSLLEQCFPLDLIMNNPIEWLFDMLYRDDEILYVPLFVLQNLNENRLKEQFNLKTCFLSRIFSIEPDSHLSLVNHILQIYKGCLFDKRIVNFLMYFSVNKKILAEKDYEECYRISFYLKLRYNEEMPDYESFFDDPRSNAEYSCFLRKTFVILEKIQESSEDNKTYQDNMDILYCIVRILNLNERDFRQILNVDDELQAKYMFFRSILTEKELHKAYIEFRNLLNRIKNEKVEIPPIKQQDNLIFNKKIWGSAMETMPVEEVHIDKLQEKINKINESDVDANEHVNVSIGMNLVPYIDISTNNMLALKIKYVIYVLTNPLPEQLKDIDQLLYLRMVLLNTSNCPAGVAQGIENAYFMILQAGFEPLYKIDIKLPEKVSDPESINKLNIDTLDSTIEAKKLAWKGFLGKLVFFIQQEIVDSRFKLLSVYQPWFFRKFVNGGKVEFINDPAHSDLLLKNLMLEPLGGGEGKLKFDSYTILAHKSLNQHSIQEIFNEFYHEGYIPHIIQETKNFLEKCNYNFMEFIFTYLLKNKEYDMGYIIIDEKSEGILKRCTDIENDKITLREIPEELQAYFDNDCNLKEGYKLKSIYKIFEKDIIEFLTLLEIFVNVS